MQKHFSEILETNDDSKFIKEESILIDDEIFEISISK